MPIFLQIQSAIENGHVMECQKLTKQALEEGYDPVRILTEAMMPAMRQVGFEEDAVNTNIPRILCVARSMQRGMEVLEEHMCSKEDWHVGTIVIGTVAGDLHEVGKNLVAMMFRSVGFRVVDLGVDVTAKEFVQALKDHPETQVVCLSALLSTSLGELRQAVKSIRKTKTASDVKIMIGGGSVTQAIADEVGADAYTENAAEAALTARRLLGKELEWGKS